MKRDPTGFLREEYQKLVDQNLDWKLRVLEGASAPRCTVEGKNVLMLCSNNYLNLSNHPKLKEAAKTIIDTHGVGSGSVRAIAGNMDVHVKVEKALARFKGTEAALVYQTGFIVESPPPNLKPSVYHVLSFENNPISYSIAQLTLKFALNQVYEPALGML